MKTPKSVVKGRPSIVVQICGRIMAQWAGAYAALPEQSRTELETPFTEFLPAAAWEALLKHTYPPDGVASKEGALSNIINFNLAVSSLMRGDIEPLLKYCNVDISGDIQGLVAGIQMRFNQNIHNISVVKALNALNIDLLKFRM